MQGHRNTLEGMSPLKLGSLPNPNHLLHAQEKLLSDHATIHSIAESFHVYSQPSSTIYKKNKISISQR